MNTKYFAFFKRFQILDTLCPKSGMRLGWSHYRALVWLKRAGAGA